MSLRERILRLDRAYLVWRGRGIGDCDNCGRRRVVGLNFKAGLFHCFNCGHSGVLRGYDAD